MTGHVRTRSIAELEVLKNRLNLSLGWSSPSHRLTAGLWIELCVLTSSITPLPSLVPGLLYQLRGSMRASNTKWIPSKVAIEVSVAKRISKI